MACDVDVILWYLKMKFERWRALPFEKKQRQTDLQTATMTMSDFFNAVHNEQHISQTDLQCRDTTTVTVVASKTLELKWVKTCMRLLDAAMRTSQGSDLREYARDCQRV